MNVSELYDLMYWIQDEIVAEEIQEKYQELFSVLQQNTQPNQSKKPFESQKDNLITAIERVSLSQLNKEQLSFLELLKIKSTVGDEGVMEINDILVRNALDIATAADKVQKMLVRLSQGIEKSNQIRIGLDGCVSYEEYEKIGEVMMRVTFAGGAAMNNIVDFKRWGSIWHEIGRGIAMAHDAHPEDIKVIGATKGSVIIELATVPVIATTVSAIIYSALKLAEKVLDIKKKAEEIKNMQLNNKKLAQEIEKEAEKEKDIGMDRILNSLVDQLNIQRDGDGEKITALNKAIKNLIDFVEFGGEVDFVLPDEDGKNNGDNMKDENLDKYEKLQDVIKEIRILESNLRLLDK